MAGINLLPWRAERRKKKQQQFLSITALALLGTAAILLFIHAQIASMIEFQMERNRYLDNEIAQVDQKIKEIQDLEARKNRLIAKMDVIQQLQTSRPEIVHMLDELSRTIPEGVQLSDFSQSGTVLTINGSAPSNARVSAYMRNLEASPWLQDPSLSVIESKPLQGTSKKNRQGSSFTLQVRQADKSKDNSGKKPS